MVEHGGEGLDAGESNANGSGVGERGRANWSHLLSQGL